ncbi:hypothetical protein ACFE04_000196 [Oxalis oulophora]
MASIKYCSPFLTLSIFLVLLVTIILCVSSFNNQNSFITTYLPFHDQTLKQHQVFLSPLPSPNSTTGFSRVVDNNSLAGKPKKRVSVERLEDGLAKSRAAIQEAIRTRNYTSYKNETYIPTGAIYRNAIAFHQLSFQF